MNNALVSGVTGAAPIWNKLMRHVLEGKPDIWPKQPDHVVGGRVCAINGLLPPNASATGNEPDDVLGCPTRFEYFIKGTIGRSPASDKQTVAIDKTTGDLAPANQQDNIEMQEHSIMSDGISRWCIDCTHADDKPVFVN